MLNIFKKIIFGFEFAQENEKYKNNHHFGYFCKSKYVLNDK